MCIHCSLRKQKCRLKSTTTNGWHFGQSVQRKSSVLFPVQSEKSPDSGFFTCDPTKKCIMPSSRERHKGIIGRGHDLRLRSDKLQQHVAVTNRVYWRIFRKIFVSRILSLLQQVAKNQIILNLSEFIAQNISKTAAKRSN